MSIDSDTLSDGRCQGERAQCRRSALAVSRRSSSIEARISGISVNRKAAGLLNEPRPRALPPAHDPDRRRRSQHVQNRAGDDEPQCPVRPVPSCSDRCGSVARSPTDADRGGSSGLAARSGGGALDAGAAVGVSLPMAVYEHAVGLNRAGQQVPRPSQMTSGWRRAWLGWPARWSGLPEPHRMVSAKPSR